MKKLLSSALLALFLFNTIGYYPLFVLMTNVNQEKMFERLSEEDNLQELRIHRSEMAGVVFKDDGEEIIYKGEMYDIRDQRTQGEYVIFRCIHDKHERNLLAGLERHSRQDQTSAPSKKKSDNSIKKGIENFYIPNEAGQYSSEARFVYGNHEVNFSSFRPIPSPPPPKQVG